MSGVQTDRPDARRVELMPSARHGAWTWIKERASSAVLIPLTLWALWAGAGLAGGGYEGAAAWITQPVNAGLLLISLLVAIYHMHLGLRVVIEDYIHLPPSKPFLLGLNLGVCLALAAISAFYLMRAALGSAQAGV